MKRLRFLDPSGFTRSGILTDGTIQAGGRSYSPDSITYLPPCTPSKIVCVGLNYADHADETNSSVPDRPKLFLKPPSTVRAHGTTIELPFTDRRFDPEAELAVVIDEQARDLKQDRAMEFVRGFTCFNDLSNRTDQRQEQNWVRGKAFDGAAALGPVVATPDEVPRDASIEGKVNGETRQSSSRDKMIFDVPNLLAEITRYMTLEPGDVVATGTPRGVEPLEDGDVTEITVEGIGTLRNEIKMPH